MVEMENESHIWIDTRLTEEGMIFLWDAISKENKIDYSDSIEGNLSRSELLTDKNNWFYETILKRLCERMFYRNWANYYKYFVEKEESLPKFKLELLWVNYQKQHEFNPLHDHGGLYSFVIFMKIPTHWQEQYNLGSSIHTDSIHTSNFQFIQSEKNNEFCKITEFRLSSEDEGRMLFFPSWLQHQVYPFYGTEEERITISGNVTFYDDSNPNMTKDRQIGKSVDLEENLKLCEEQIKWLKEMIKIEKERDK